MSTSLLLTTPELKSVGFIGGIDEVGRGCLAGPVVAACVVFSWNELSFIKNMNNEVCIRDSKLMTRSHRILANQLIRERALSVGIGSVSAQDIDEINILQATFRAMRAALQECVEGLRKKDLLRNDDDISFFIDGNMIIPNVHWKQKAVVGGDSQVFSIAAASIIAKEFRDLLMEQYQQDFPQYGFMQHKGYGTKDHFRALEIHGPCPLHRKTFLKRFNEV